MELQIQNAGAMQVSDVAFGREYNQTLVHQVVTAYMAGARAGTKAQKSRSDVRGGGAKPWRQKGTGRARAGTSRSPIWRSGGVTFAARPRDHSQKVNRKMYRSAICAILSELVRKDRMIIVESFKLEQPKTKELIAKLKDFNLSDVLVVSEDVDENLYLASRNLYHVGITDVASLDPVSMVGFDKMLVTVDALKKIEEWLA